MLAHLPDPPSGPPAGLAWLPPLVGLAGALQCGLPAATRGALALACGLRLAWVWRSRWAARARARSAGAGASVMLLHASASGPLTWRGSPGTALLVAGADSRVDATGVRLLAGGTLLAITPRSAGPRAARALARWILVRHDPRWQPCLPQRWPRRARRRARARFGYNRVLRVRRPPPCLPS